MRLRRCSKYSTSGRINRSDLKELDRMLIRKEWSAAARQLWKANPSLRQLKKKYLSMTIYQRADLVLEC